MACQLLRTERKGNGKRLAGGLFLFFLANEIRRLASVRIPLYFVFEDEDDMPSLPF